MYQIGQASKITKISSRMLRYYDAENILKPSVIQPNGYRLYSDNDIEVILRIKKLKKFHFSYQEIKALLSAYDEIPQAVYLKKLEELKHIVDDYDLLITELKRTHTHSSTFRERSNPYDISLTHKKTFTALCQKSIVTDQTLETFLNKVFKKFTAQSYTLSENFFLIFHTDLDNSPEYFEVEYCQPILTGPCPKSFESKIFLETLYISTLHYGDYSKLYLAYEQLYKWASCNHFQITGPFLEKYYVDDSYTSESSEFITEISVAVSK
ncbi:MAG: MerR family transcriptional regulator [Cellulosilyticaceae bacterium]